jgi:hypothetical protein
MTAACTASNITTAADSDGGSCAVPKGLVWVAPTTNADGTPLLDLAGYKLHYDTNGRGSDSTYHYTNAVDIGMPSCTNQTGGATECQYDPSKLGLPAGAKVYVTVTAYDHAVPPNESAYSNETTVTP